MERHENITWDQAKTQSNADKHGVTFELAQQVLKDPYGDQFHLEIDDTAHSINEERWITLGSLPYDRNHVLYVVWTEIVNNVTRIISARKATKQEKNYYDQNIK